MITKIEDFFDYYWDNNKLSAFTTENDNRFINELPSSVQSEIFIDYLFTDFLYKYKYYFNPKQTKKRNMNHCETDHHAKKGEVRLHSQRTMSSFKNDVNEHKLREF